MDTPRTGAERNGAGTLRPSPGSDQYHEARLSAVPGCGWRGVARRGAGSDLSAGLLAAHRKVLEGKRSRPVPDGRADRAGVDVHRGCTILRQCVRADAAASVDGAALR